MSEEHRRAGSDIPSNDVAPKRSMRHIRREYGDNAGVRDRIQRCERSNAIGGSLVPACASRAHADDNVDAVVAQIERLGAGLAAVADHCYALGPKIFGVHIVIRVELHKFFLLV